MTDKNINPLKLNIDGSVADTPKGIRIFPSENGFVVSDTTGWLDGEYLTVEDAIAATLP